MKDSLEVSVIIDDTTKVKLSITSQNQILSSLKDLQAKYNLSNDIMDNLYSELSDNFVTYTKAGARSREKQSLKYCTHNLYLRGLESQMSKVSKLESIKKEKEEISYKEFTFTPTINKRSNLLTEKKFQKIEDKLLNDKAMYNARMEQRKLILSVEKRTKEKGKNTKVTNIPKPEVIETKEKIEEHQSNRALIKMETIETNLSKVIKGKRKKQISSSKLNYKEVVKSSMPSSDRVKKKPKAYRKSVEMVINKSIDKIDDEKEEIRHSAKKTKWESSAKSNIHVKSEVEKKIVKSKVYEAKKVLTKQFIRTVQKNEFSFFPQTNNKTPFELRKGYSKQRMEELAQPRVIQEVPELMLNFYRKHKRVKSHGNVTRPLTTIQIEKNRQAIADQLKDIEDEKNRILTTHLNTAYSRIDRVVEGQVSEHFDKLMAGSDNEIPSHLMNRYYKEVLNKLKKRGEKVTKRVFIEMVMEMMNY